MQYQQKYNPAQKTKAGIDGLMSTFFNAGLQDFVGHDGLKSAVFVNVLEHPDDFSLELAAPGFEKQDFIVAVENGQLKVQAKRSAQVENTDGRFTRREFLVADFERSFKLPKTVNQEAIEAVYENGVLLVKLPKKEEAKPMVKSITVG